MSMMFELKHRIGERRAWAVWAAAVSVYVLGVFHRTSLAVAGLTAAERFDISAAQLATFTMVQLLVYAGMQIPVGVLLDRYGSKRLIGTGLALMTVGQLSFAFADSFALGLVSRVLVGLGDSMVFVSVLRLVMLWFPPARSPVITQFTGLLGQLGTIIAAIPMARALAEFGWTTAFAASALVGVVLGVVLYVVVIDTPYVTSSRREHALTDVAENVREAWAQPGTQLGLWTHFTTQFSVVGVGGPSSLVGFDFARTFNPAQRLGSATGIVNIGGFLASLTTIIAVGVVLDVMTPGSSSDYSPEAFTWAMSVQYVVWAFGGWQIWRYRRRTRRMVRELGPDAFPALLRH